MDELKGKPRIDYRTRAAPRVVYTTEACAAPGVVYSLHQRCLSCIWRVYTTKACAAPGVVYTAGPELHLTCLHYRGLCCSWSCLHHRGLSCIWRDYTTEACAAPGVVYPGLNCIWRVYTTEACAAPGVAYTTEAWTASEVSTLQRPVLHLNVFSPPWPELHLDLSILLISPWYEPLRGRQSHISDHTF